MPDVPRPSLCSPWGLARGVGWWGLFASIARKTSRGRGSQDLRTAELGLLGPSFRIVFPSPGFD